MADTELPPAAYLRDLAERLMHIPVMYGIDQGDSDRLAEIAREIEKAPARHDDEGNSD
jgi:hypothetical protein